MALCSSSRVCFARSVAASVRLFQWGGQALVDDVLAGVDFLHSQPEIETIGVIGFSMGGMQALEAAA